MLVGHAKSGCAIMIIIGEQISFRIAQDLLAQVSFCWGSWAPQTHRAYLLVDPVPVFEDRLSIVHCSQLNQLETNWSSQVGNCIFFWVQNFAFSNCIFVVEHLIEFRSNFDTATFCDKMHRTNELSELAQSMYSNGAPTCRSWHIYCELYAV